MDTPTGNMGPGSTSATDTGAGTRGSMGTKGSSTGSCDHCGQPLDGSGVNSGLEQFLGKLGINEDMINNLKSSIAKVDIDEYLDTARHYLRKNSRKARTYARRNPGKVIVGAVVLAVGAGLLVAALNRD